ncbi:MAG: transporter substrate-binding domain-containing protein [Bacillota bacterium]
MRRRSLVVLLVMLLVSALVLTLAGCGQSKTPNIAKIKKRGVLKVGVKADVIGFGFKNPATNKFEGLEIDLAKRIAKEMLGDENKVEFTAVTAKTRQGLMDNGEVDMVIATFTITEERKKIIDFSPVYYVDGIRLLVKKDSGIKSLADMNGKIIGVAKGADTQIRLEAKAAPLNVKPKFQAYETYSEILAALQAGRVQAFSTDAAILKFYEKSDPTTEILPDRYSDEDYGVATKKGNDDLKDFVATVVNKLKDSGELKTMWDKWGLTNK